jgi:hypothetical protein
MEKVKPIETPPLDLKHASADEYCTAVRQSSCTSFWWYFLEGPMVWQSRPFRIADGSWWYQVKPGFCWPVEILTPRQAVIRKFPYVKSFVGFQHLIDGRLGNSRQVINTISDLPGYSTECIDAKRRNAIRKGLRECAVETVRAVDGGMVGECHSIWADFTRRTGWKHPVSKAYIDKTFNELLAMPGTTILTGKDVASGRCAGFLIAKLIGDTAFVDTIASHTDLLHTNVNDALMYCFLISAKAVAGIQKAHYAIKSYDTHLEDFKKSIGFSPTTYPAYTCLRPGVRPALKTLFPRQYARMTGMC